jgi:hypothetical protein
MDEALAEWLRLREELDHESRSPAVLEAVLGRLPAHGPIRAVDLATGTGSNLRYLIPRLPGPQRWTVIDRSPALLGHLMTRTVAWAEALGLNAEVTASGCRISGTGMDCQVQVKSQDLAAMGAERLLDGCHLVTASALLDLVSTSWLDLLAAKCRAAGTAALFTITYDGRSHCLPLEPEDEQVRVLFNRHQARDKGLGGPAAGPSAATAAARAFERAGFAVRMAPSDWLVPDAAQEFQRQLIDGWAEASTEVSPDLAETIAGWRVRRLAHVTEGRSRITVGHHDLAAWIAG